MAATKILNSRRNNDEASESMRATRSLWICFLDIAALNSFAIAQPVIDRLNSNPEYLHLMQYSGIVMSAVLGIYLLALPVCVTACVALLRWLNCRKAANLLFGITGTVLMTLIVNLALRWLQWECELRKLGIPDSLLAVASVPIGIKFSWLYRRFTWPGQFLNFAAIGLILFPAHLLSNPAMQVEILGLEPKDSTKAQVGNPVPIVIVAFDGLCGMALLNEEYDIDEIRYPAFAKLAGKGTFYRNATSVHCRTSQAMPAILTGNLPDDSKVSPVPASHPNNLFRLIHETDEYDMTVFEAYTRLCPPELRQVDHELTFTQQVTDMTVMLARVYLVTTAPADVDVLQPQIPRLWFGFVPDFTGHESTTRGLVTYEWDADHEIQVDHFVHTLTKTVKPGFHFLHIVTPHDPWSHFPSGAEYLRRARINTPTPGTVGEGNEHWGDDELMVQQGWQRYLLELQNADRCLGRIIERLEEIDEYDRSLLVVVADHGMAFVPGQHRRTPVNTTLPDLMSVPLFVKLPGQANGDTSDVNVETIDVFPTIADIIQLPLPNTVDGQSIVANDFHERPRKTMQFDVGRETIVEPEFPQRFNYVERMAASFGTGGTDDRLWSLNTKPDLIDRNISLCDIGRPSRWACRLERGDYKTSPRLRGIAPYYFSGELTGPEVEHPVQIAIVVNGQVAGTTRTCQNRTQTRQWSILLKEKQLLTQNLDVRFYEIEQIAAGYLLHEIKSTIDL